ncbi:MAG: hypothetical protein M3R29_03395 [Verrucomicrobiota bacterium]|nr:hypothetical protein [Verrucomicrobiota bacterium]
MKRMFCLSVMVSLLGATPAFCGDSTTVKNWSNVQTYELATLKKNIESQTRKIVGVRFNFRGKDIHHMKPNWYESSLWQPNPGGKGFVDVQVMVAKKDLPAFKAIPTDAQSAQVITIYGQVLRDSEANFPFVRLMGRNATPDQSGNAILSW